MDRVVLTICHEPPPGTNAQRKMHWAKRAQLMQTWRQLAYVAWLDAGRPVVEHPVITATFHYRTNRVRDPDNPYDGLKPIIDGLKRYAWPGDDDAKTIRLNPISIAVDKTNPRVEIAIESADDSGGAS